jgi:hypothetical protein
MQSVKSLSTVNRILIGASMLSAAGLTVLSFALTPWEGDLTGGDYFRSLAEYPTQASLAATVLHTGYLLLAPAAIGLYVLLQGRARLPGALGVVLAVIGFGNLSTLTKRMPSTPTSPPTRG